MRSPFLPFLAALVPVACALGCSGSGTSNHGASRAAPEPASAGPVTYEVHEWGLVRGTADDRVVLSGPHAAPRVMPIAKPVLYLHRRGEGELVVDVSVRLVDGRIVEHWPWQRDAEEEGTGSAVVWRGVTVREGSCAGSRYPTIAEHPCSPQMADGCEASTLARVETDDSDCLIWPPRAGADGPAQTWNHLFYRGEIRGTPPLPLRLEPLPDGTLRVTSLARESIPGQLVRVRRARGAEGVTDAVAIASAPGPGQSVIVPSPSQPITEGPIALAAGLAAAGLTAAEIAAFRRAWDETLFGADAVTEEGASGATRVPALATASPFRTPRPTTSLLYVLPPASADALAPLSFSPPPTAVRRAIVAWIEEDDPSLR